MNNPLGSPEFKKLVSGLRDLLPGMTKADIRKGGPGSGRYPAGSGGNTASSAQRHNARQDKMYDEARIREIERLGRGEKPNPNLTDLVTSRTHIAGEHNIYATKQPDGDYVYSVRYKPSSMFEGAGRGGENLGVHRTSAQAHNIVDAHKEKLIADWNTKARANKGQLISDTEKGGPGSGRYPKGSGQDEQASTEASRTQDVRGKDYINSIKNPQKKAYAEAYHDWKLHGQSGSNVGEPSVRDSGLSYMGAQAVRIRLDEIHDSAQTSSADLESKQEQLQSHLRNQGMHQSDAMNEVAAMNEGQIDSKLNEIRGAEAKEQTRQDTEHDEAQSIQDEVMSRASRMAEEGRQSYPDDNYPGGHDDADPEFTPSDEERERLSDPSYGAKGTKSDFRKVVDFVRDNITKGGPGSGRYPAGSGGQENREGKQPAEYRTNVDGKPHELALDPGTGATVLQPTERTQEPREGTRPQDAPKVKELNDFRQSYIESLSAKTLKDPSYAGQTYTPEQVETTVDNMIRALARGTAGSISSQPAMRAAAKKLGIKTTDELKAWVKERYADDEGQYKNTPDGDISKYITHSDGKYIVHSESGKPMGTYDSEAGAKKRLAQIEHFKNVKKSFETFRDLLAKDAVNKDVVNSYPNPVYRGEVKLPPVLEDSKPTEEGKIRISGDTSGQGGIGPGGTGIGAGGATNPK